MSILYTALLLSLLLMGHAVVSQTAFEVEELLKHTVWNANPNLKQTKLGYIHPRSSDYTLHVGEGRRRMCSKDDVHKGPLVQKSPYYRNASPRYSKEPEPRGSEFCLFAML